MSDLIQRLDKLILDGWDDGGAPFCLGEHHHQAFIDSRVEIERLTARNERLHGQINYSIALQRAIEYHCRGKEVPEVIAKDCPHHAKMLNARILESQATS